MQLPEGLIRDARLTDAAVLVAGYVAQFGGPDGCFAAEATIANELGYSDERTAGRALAALEHAGWMRTEMTASGRCSRWIMPARPGERVNLPRTLLQANASFRPHEIRVYAIARYWLETGQQVTAARVAEALPHTKLRTAKDHLQTVVEHGLLLRVGRGRGTRYRLADPAITAGQGTSDGGYPQDTAEWCKSGRSGPVDNREMVQIEAGNGANRGARNGANPAPREGAPSIEGAPYGSPVVTPPSSLDVVSAPAPEGDEGDSSIEHWTEERSWRSADADQPEQTTDQDEPTEECIEAAQGIVADLRPDMWPLDTKQAGRLVARIARLLCFGGYDDEQLAAHLAAPPPPDVRDPFALLLARLRHDRLPILQPALEATPMPFVPSARDGAACEGHPGEVSDHCRICHADLVAIHGVRGDRWRTYGHTPHAALQALNGQSAPTESASEIQIPTQSAYKAVRGHASVDPRETLGKAA